MQNVNDKTVNIDDLKLNFKTMNGFARKQLEKYGWTEGKGLGKEENGIKKPIRPVVKLDTHGVGHDRVNVLASTWWCDAFNEASQRVNVVNDKTGVQISSKKSTPIEDVSPSPIRIKQKFVKAEVINDYHQIPAKCDAEKSICKTKTSKQRGDQLYQKCHGVKNKKEKFLKAKHKRALKQEMLYAKRKSMDSNESS